MHAECAVERERERERERARARARERARAADLPVEGIVAVNLRHHICQLDRLRGRRLGSELVI
eukprot:SAG31_NODE_437_length_15714_cov_8.527344_8_plen_63_part_00